MHDEEVIHFLSYLATTKNLSISTQKSALNALVYLYTQFFDKPLSQSMHFNKAAVPRKIPIVLTPQEFCHLLMSIPTPHDNTTGLLPFALRVRIAGLK